MNPDFPVTRKIVHMNHAGVGPWPAATAAAVRHFADENAGQGSLEYPRWMQVENELREKIRILLNARGTDEIGLVKNTSEGLSLVAYGLDWNKGDNVVGIAQEFPSNRLPWMSLQDKGVEFRQLDLDQAADPEAALFDLCDAHTRLISVSAIQYHNGFRMDLDKIGAFCRARDILFCVDAIQQIGALPFDVQATGVDFAIADGHKWMLGPEGLGLFYVRRERLHSLKLLQYGWHMVKPMQDYAQKTFEDETSAKRFECGSPNMLGIFAMNASLDVLLQSGMRAVGDQVIHNTRYLMDGLRAIDGIEILTDPTPQRLSGIVTFRHHKLDSALIYRHLMQQRILCAHRGGGVRLSPHFYIPQTQLDKTLEEIRLFASDKAEGRS